MFLLLYNQSNIVLCTETISSVHVLREEAVKEGLDSYSKQCNSTQYDDWPPTTLHQPYTEQPVSQNSS